MSQSNIVQRILKVKNHITLGVENNETIYQVADKVRNACIPTNSRALTIARTEMRLR